MDVITLGTGSPIPSPDRAGPATLVRAAGRDLLFDCGRGVLLRAAAVMSGAVNFHTVYLTHLHSDHVTDFNDLVTTRWAMSPVENPLQVVGPVGTQAFVDRTLAMLETDIGYRLTHHDDLNWNPGVVVTEIEAGPEGTVVSDDGTVKVLAATTDHAPVHPTLGYRVEADGAAVVIAGDTVPCPGLSLLCENADVYVQTVIRPSMIEQIPSARLQDVVDYHSSVEDAGTTAAKGGVGTLVLTHPVPPPFPGSEHEWVDEATAFFDGEVVLAHDLFTVSVPPPAG